jgi:hypothetical protein
MALSDTSFSSKLQVLYNSMNESPMSLETFADKMASILDAQTKTAEVNAGIAVTIPTTSPEGSSSSGQTSAKGSLS